MKTKNRKPPFQSTAIAKFLYGLGGYLTRVKIPTRMYEWDSETNEFSRLPWRWFGWSLGYKIGLGWSPEWDYKHWDHWALDHKGCRPSYCLGCKGYVCGHGDHE